MNFVHQKSCFSHCGRLEYELNRWSVPVNSASTENIYATLTGRTVRYLMKSNEITFGRNTKDNVVDVDLSLEGVADKISRKQGTIKLRYTGDFLLLNYGKRPIFVNGQPILKNRTCKLHNNSVVEIAELSFVFLINHELVKTYQQEYEKIEWENFGFNHDDDDNEVPY